ncbi:DUF3558 domain-containing protein [Actinosynnema sp. CS-041913]|uniref:DUF3558 domain-containing protein n=1 Tax=Actinosynnema sp. CS-041913 TaxID=3239917 RepID=UPI003D8AD8EF
MRRAVPLFAAVLLLAGCSSTTTGSPTSGSTPGSTASEPSSAGKPTSTAKEPAKRPKTINVRDVDPCTLLTEAQRTQFGADQPPTPGTVEELNWVTCHFNRGDRKYLIGTTVIVTEGIEFYTESAQRDKAEKLEVGGFPAVLIKNAGRVPKCTIAVDVSDGQMVQAGVSSFDGTDIDALCQLVPQVAGAVVANLMAK